MNFHVAGLTPTQRAAVMRHQSFKANIEASAAALARRKVNEALEALCVVARETPLSQTPLIQSAEAMPTEGEPSPNWFVMLATDPKRSDYPSIRDIQKTVCKYYDVRLIDVLSTRRTAIIVKPRQVAMYLCKSSRCILFRRSGAGLLARTIRPCSMQCGRRSAFVCPTRRSPMTSPS
jgi:hypothetical protein